MTGESAELDRHLFAGLEVLKSQQSEINRRLGILETRVEEALAVKDQLDGIETAMADRKGWRTWLLQTIGSVILITVLAALGSLFGVEVKW